MKRTALFVGAVLLSITMVACGSSSGNQASSNRTVSETNVSSSSRTVSEASASSSSRTVSEASASSSSKTVSETVVSSQTETPVATPTETEEKKQKEPAIDGDLTLDNFEELMESDVQKAIGNISQKADTVIKAIGDSYNSYMQSKDDITEWYAFALAESGKLYESLIEKSIVCYKLISSQKAADDDFDWDHTMDDIYDAWNDATEDYYEVWDDLHEDIYDQWNDALEDDSVDYAKISEAWSTAYKNHSESWSAMYEAHSSAWKELYGNHSEVWSGFLSGKSDVDRMIQNAKEKREKDTTEQEKSEKQKDSDIKEDISKKESEESKTDTYSTEDTSKEESKKTPKKNNNKTTESNTVFEPQDVSDATIESIKTNGDYLVMYRKIIDDYLANYESVLKGTVLYDEAAFQDLKDEMDKTFEEQEKTYGATKNAPIVGKDSIIEFLKNYRDSLQTMIDSYAKALNVKQ